MNRLLFVLLLSLGCTCFAQADTVAVFEREVRPLLQSLCYDCHGPDQNKGDLRFDRLDPDLVKGDDTETWHDALDQLNLGEMPPADATQPTTEQRQRLTDWILAALREATEAKRFQNGRVVTRRLTKYEYANSMRDLLGIELDFARELPPDPPSQEGFLNNGATLEMSPTQIEMYLSTARRALAEVIVSGEAPRTFETSQTETAVGKLPTRKFAGHEPVQPEFVLDLHEFPRHGEFELTIDARAAIPARQGHPQMRVSMGHVPGIIHVPRGEVDVVDVSDELQTFTFRGRMEDFPQPGPVAFGNAAFKGMIVMIDFLDADGNELRYPDRKYVQPPPAPKKNKNQKKDSDEAKGGVEQAEVDRPQPVPFGDRLEIEVASVHFRSPLHETWPPAQHQRLIFASDHSDDESRYVRELLQPFMTSAFRRPVSEREVEETAQLFDGIRSKTDSFEEAVREVFAAVLVSPHFLYIVERRDQQSGPQRITDFELASRLSYFLWSAAPDRRLLDLARQGKLRDGEVLQHEVARMLDDERSSEFTQRFVDQWLDLDALERVAINPEFFPDFDDQLKQQMRLETQAYFAEILRNDHSALELLDSNWAMLNRPLAEHYGLPGPRSSRFERVDLADSNRRGGLLGQGAFLLANANGEDSHPIKRAVWILARLLDSPPASPPADVPDLDTESPDMARLSLKEQLAVHREKESCANCHQGIDPWGIPLEDFDAVGRWRTEVPAHGKRPAAAVDSISVLPGGVRIGGAEQLQRYLVEECRDRFARSVVKRLMAYGLGRSIDFGDRDTVGSLTSRFVESDFRLRSLIIDFVQSESFQTK